MQRRKSIWGWGWEDAFPSTSARERLAQRIAPMLGLDTLPVHEPAPEDAWTLTPARLDAPAALASMLTSARRDRAAHAHGKSFRDLARGLRGDFATAPDLVAYPRSREDIEQLMSWCAAERVAFVPYGGGTSVVDGVEMARRDRFNGVVSVDLQHFDRVVEVDPISRAARIEAGATGPALESQLEAHGLTLRHFPQSFEFSTLGGWIATRAGGHFATVYTHIDDLVESVTMLTPTGRLQTRRLPASGAGPAPERLVLGSEGTLGVITEAWMRVRPRPTFRVGASFAFADFERAVDATRALSQSGLFPSNCRLLDATEAMIHRVSADGSNILLVAFESDDHAVDAWISRARAICAAHGAHEPAAAAPTASHGPDAVDSWRTAFLEAPYLFNSLVSLGLVVDTFETAITWDRFHAFHDAVRAAVQTAMQRECGGGVISCRFTHVYPDGPAPYYTFVAPATASNHLERWDVIKRAACDAIESNGGTITHHHAVGRMHRPWYERERSEVFARGLRALKRELDPAGVMNPGVLFEE